MTSSSRAKAIALAFKIGMGAVSFATAAYAEPTAADLESARVLFRQARELRTAGDLKGALEKFKAAHALGQTAVTGIELARTYAVLNQLVEAREICLGIGRMAVQSDETERSDQARSDAVELAEALRARIPALTIQVAPETELGEVQVAVDGESLPREAIGHLYAVNPGDHAVVLTRRNGAVLRGAITLKEAEQRTVLFNLPPVRTDVASPPGSPVTPKKSRIDPVVGTGFAVAIAGVGIGTFTGLLAYRISSDLDDRCRNNKCGPNAHESLDAAKSLADVSTAAFIIGGVGAGIGVLGLVLRKKDSSTGTFAPYVTVQGIGLRGTF